MFSFFFDTPPAEQEPTAPKLKTATATVKTLAADPLEKYKIDPGYYFKHLDPA